MAQPTYNHAFQYADTSQIKYIRSHMTAIHVEAQLDQGRLQFVNLETGRNVAEYMGTGTHWFNPSMIQQNMEPQPKYCATPSWKHDQDSIQLGRVIHVVETFPFPLGPVPLDRFTQWIQTTISGSPKFTLLLQALNLPQVRVTIDSLSKTSFGVSYWLNTNLAKEHTAMNAWAYTYSESPDADRTAPQTVFESLLISLFPQFQPALARILEQKEQKEQKEFQWGQSRATIPLTESDVQRLVPLKVPLRPSQLETIRFVLERESTTRHMYDHMWWELPCVQVHSHGATPARTPASVFYNPYHQEMSLGPPVLFTGGWNCNPTGAGKPLEMLAAIHANPATKPFGPYNMFHQMHERGFLGILTDDQKAVPLGRNESSLPNAALDPSNSLSSSSSQLHSVSNPNARSTVDSNPNGRPLFQRAMQTRKRKSNEVEEVDETALSIQTLWNQYVTPTTLIIAKNNVEANNWKRSLTKFFQKSPLRVEVFYEAKHSQDAWEVLKNRTDILITTYKAINTLNEKYESKTQEQWRTSPYTYRGPTHWNYRSPPFRYLWYRIIYDDPDFRHYHAHSQPKYYAISSFLCGAYKWIVTSTPVHKYPIHDFFQQVFLLGYPIRLQPSQNTKWLQTALSKLCIRQDLVTEQASQSNEPNFSFHEIAVPLTQEQRTLYVQLCAAVYNIALKVRKLHGKVIKCAYLVRMLFHLLCGVPENSRWWVRIYSQQSTLLEKTFQEEAKLYDRPPSHNEARKKALTMIGNSCPVCSKEYSDSNRVFYTRCGHVLCGGCVAELLGMTHNNICGSCGELISRTSTKDVHLEESEFSEEKFFGAEMKSLALCSNQSFVGKFEAITRLYESAREEHKQCPAHLVVYCDRMSVLQDAQRYIQSKNHQVGKIVNVIMSEMYADQLGRELALQKGPEIYFLMTSEFLIRAPYVIFLDTPHFPYDLPAKLPHSHVCILYFASTVEEWRIHSQPTPERSSSEANWPQLYQCIAQARAQYEQVLTEAEEGKVEPLRKMLGQ